MAVQAVGDRILVTFVGRLLQQRTMNTFLYRVASVPPGTDIGVLAGFIYTELNTTGGLASRYLDCVPVNLSLEQIWIQTIAPTRYTKSIFTVGDVGSGGQADTANVQQSITRKGELAGRFSIGGIRVPCATTVDTITDGKLTTSALAALNALAGEMKETLSVASGTATLVPQVGTPPAPVNSIDLVDTIAENTVRVIRRRTVGLGI